MTPIRFRLRLGFAALLVAAAFLTSPLAHAQEQRGPSLPDGQIVVLRNLTRLSSAVAKVGDAVEFEVVRPVSADGLVIVPEHAVATGKVAGVVPKKSRGRGGQLVIDIERLTAITGQPMNLRGQAQHSIRTERGKEIAGLEMQTLGFGVAVIPVILLQRGPDMVVEPGTRFDAFVDGEQTFDRGALERAQALIPAPRQDVAVVYIYRRLDNKPDDIDSWPFTCGEAYVGTLDRGRYIRLELPRGLYWIRYGLTEIDMFEADPAQFFQLRVEGGHTYYVRQVTDRTVSWTKGPLLHLEMVDDGVGADEVAELIAPAAGSPGAMIKYVLQRAQRQPMPKPKKDRK